MKIKSLMSFLLLLGLVAGCSGYREAGSGQSDGNKRQKLEGSEIVISVPTGSTSPASEDQQNPQVIYLQDKNLWFAVYEDWRDRLTTGADIRGRFIKSDGTFCGNELTITNASGNQTAPRAAYRDGGTQTVSGDTTDQVVVVWQDERPNYVHYAKITSLPTSSSCTAPTITAGPAAGIGFNGTKEWDFTIANNPASQNVGVWDGITSNATGTLYASLYNPITPGSISIVNGAQTLTDNGLGSMAGNGTGDIDYVTGVLSFTFASPPANGSTATVSYQYQTYSYDTVPISSVSTGVIASLAFNDAANTITRGSGNFRADGIAKGSLIWTSSGSLGNGGPFLVSAVTTTVLTVITTTGGNPVLTTVTETNVSVTSDDGLLSRTLPKIAYDNVRDRFWLVWNESRGTLNRISELCFRYSPHSYTFGDNSFPGYVMLDGSSLAELVNKIGIAGADIVRNDDVINQYRSRTNREIAQAHGALIETHQYEYFTSINNINVAADSTGAETFLVFQGVRKKGTLTCTCSDKDSSESCNGEPVTSSFETENSDGGYVHVYGLFDKEISQEVIYSQKLDDSTSSDSYYPALGFDPITKKFLATWEDLRDGADTKIYGQLIYSGGGLYNSNMLITFQDTDGDGIQDDNVAASKQTKPYVSYDSVNQRYFVIWEDARNGGLQNLDVFGQYVDAEGSIRGSNYSISIAPSNQYNPTIAYNSQNNQFLAVWKDARNNTTTASDVYGQRYSLGQPQLTLLKTDNTTLSPLLMNFDTVTVGQIVTKQFKIRNTGDTSLKIDCLTTPTGTNSPFSHQSLASELQTCEGTYASGTYIQLTPDNTSAGDYILSVQFQPVAVGTYTSAFTIQSDAEIKTVNLQGQAVGMTVSPSSISFSDTASGQYVDQTVVITNNSTDTTFSVTSISGAVAPFSIPSPPAFPASLDPGGQLQFTVRFSPTGSPPVAGTQYSGTLTISTSLAALNKTVTVSGKATPSTFTLLSGLTTLTTGTTLDFGSVAANTVAAKAITLRNSSTTSSITVESVTVSGTGFQLENKTMPFTINANSSDTITINFLPTDITAYSGSVQINSSGGTNTFNLSGEGTGPKIALSQGSIDFGSVKTGSSKSISITVTNIGSSNMTLSTISTLSSQFTRTYTGTLPATIAPNGVFTVSVIFAPTVAGTLNSSFSISTDASNGTVQTINVQGTGTASVVNISPNLIAFGATAPGTTNNMNMSVTNNGTADVQILRFNTPSAPFSIASPPATPYTLAAGSTLNVVIDFTPVTAGAFSSSIGILFDSDVTTTFYTVTGLGQTSGSSVSDIEFQEAGTAVASLDFGNVLPGTLDAKTITLKNNTTNSITINTASMTGTGFTTSFGTAAVTLTAGGTYPFTVTFSPTAVQAYSGTLTLTDSGAASYQLSLTGNGLSAGGGGTPGTGTSLDASGSNSGCFIATAAFGSYLDPHVMVLRKFRDEVLLTNAAGSAFVRFYYRTSPPIADFISRHESLRAMTRVLLTPIIFAVKYQVFLLMAAVLLGLRFIAKRKEKQQTFIG